MEVSRHQGDDSQLVKDISVTINGTKYEGMFLEVYFRNGKCQNQDFQSPKVTLP
jgi:hypothetical protein